MPTTGQLAALPRYDWSRSYRWNYDHAPSPVDTEIPPFPGQWEFCGLPVDSPLGIPAGPLLNGQWCLYYANLGFDVLTYKTVRSKNHECYQMPNLQPVECDELSRTGTQVRTRREMGGSWAVSFGMPSADPEYWRRDIERTRDSLPHGKLLSVSVVGTVEPNWTLDELAEDYAQCACWAVESGADTVETNFSCPNVSTCDGQLYQDTSAAQTVAERVRDRIGTTPYVIKIGHLPDDQGARALIGAVGGLVDGFAMTNSIAATVYDGEVPLFLGQPRGICGKAILAESVGQVARFRRILDDSEPQLRIVGVGGASGADDVVNYCNAGANAVQLATAPMLHPAVGIEIRAAMSQQITPARDQPE